LIRAACVRVGDCASPVSGSVTDECRQCGAPIWVGPSTVAITRTMADVYRWCIQCCAAAARAMAAEFERDQS
jgi:hypothetical protein